MTDLSKGIIEIEGVEISKITTPTDIENNLRKSYANCAVSKDGGCKLFRFDRVCVLNRFFKIKITFINEQIKNVQLFTHYDNLSYEEMFVTDCNWLKSHLGEPTKVGTHGIVYKLNLIEIGASFIESDGRCGPEEFIDIRY